MTLVKDFRFWLLAAALGLALIAAAGPTRVARQPLYRLVFVVDITRSMNTEDYQSDGQPVSRLEFVKQTLRRQLLALPCQSQVGLGVFTERRSVVLFEPIEVCAGFAEIDAAIAALDWRMAWAADSRIASGLASTLEAFKNSRDSLVFFSDGQEAPPPNPRYQPDLTVFKGQVKGLIVGVGGDQAAPIPKFDANGKRLGFYRPEDVPHRSTFGESDLNPEKIEGYDARNAPFGSRAVSGDEHLSRLHEDYLRKLAGDSGLRYQRLTDTGSLGVALQDSGFAEPGQAETGIAWQFAGLAVLALAALYWRN
ncbi:VWA domain-containing protein [Methylomonas sp. SURF-1]|uniref:VWA domain-containing protein n=1 Tax=Methylomonas aurea TaxID=2952224 RepID=A0ABT1UEP7_9GAMM|nr:vWA domain-containing protein [Methylomonas sp. SURF-1]MCQ8180170.1 VWA domain-containing protein [Methylomonas sp. SURF-1]